MSSETQGSLSLLCVEDEKDARKLLLSMIETKFPFVKLFEAENGKEGFEIYSQQTTDILVTDISMPEMDGLEMSRKIKLLNPNVMIIILTGRTDTQYLIDCIDIGINQYVLKPIVNKLLFDAIQKCIDSISINRIVKEQNDFIAALNASLMTRTEELEALNSELETFNYTVSHDLRTPLSVINGYCQVLTELCGASLDATCRAYIDEIANGVKTMNELIGTLLNFSQVNRSELKMSRVDLGNIAADISKNLKILELSERNVDFRIMPGLIAEGDKTLLKVLLENLLGNSWKYTRTKEKAIIEFGRKEANGMDIYFVRDNGVGFDPKYSDRMFAPFQRLENCEGFEGTGIGLATVQRIVHRHGGKIWAEGEAGSGATFYFTLQEGNCLKACPDL
ncbi:response regulator [Geobacter sp. OR-1]|uniref:response regulator n=1 Tax=Geobacter sp. OR-1 TaxID=1266765 RepID=UPI001364C34B|nr:response regulator [Geobacter sp. OR-1]